MKPETYAYILSGKKKTKLLVQDCTKTTIEEGHDFTDPFNPSDRHVQTGMPDGRWIEGNAVRLDMKVVILRKDYMKGKRFELPQWCGHTLSFSGKEYSIYTTSFLQSGEFVQVSIMAKRYEEIRKMISYLGK